ncbi:MULTISPECIES: hypothetical protein [unclassified Sinorhizobium]|uniref:hypothetical protein n=1 Tax=unclassified Sinorhizobium TaxID=2613772 RepID=UPI003525D44E
MNIFNEIVAEEYANDTKLGMPSTDAAHHSRRMNVMSKMTGGNGFRIPAKQPAPRANGKTRGEMKREARERANAAVNEARELRFLHSAARKRITGEIQRAATGFLATMQAAA